MSKERVAPSITEWQVEPLSAGITHATHAKPKIGAGAVERRYNRGCVRVGESQGETPSGKKKHRVA